MDRFHERALRYLYNDQSFETVTLADRIVYFYSLVDRPIQNMLIIVFRVLKNYPSEYLKDLFKFRINTKALRERNKLQVLEPNITGFGLNQ